LPPLPLQLEYFRRYQLQIQKTYYRKRGSDHARAYRIQEGIVIALALLTLLLLAIAADNAFWPPQSFGVIGEWVTKANEHNAFLGILIATLTAALANWSLISQDENNAQRYAATLKNLEKAEFDYLASARQAAEVGNKQGVIEFVDYVNQFVSLEHRQWIVLQDIAARPDLGPLGAFKLPSLHRRS